MKRAARLVGLIAAVLAAVVAAIAWGTLWVPGTRYDGRLPSLTGEESDLATRLARHVDAIASRPHNTSHPDALADARRYIERTLSELGFKPEAQTYVAGGVTVANIWVTMPAAKAHSDAPVLVVGAHYDSAGIAPGANDNGTGTAAVLELARLLQSMPPSPIEIRLVLFVNEEPPWFETPLMGSRQYARLLAEEKRSVLGMISLETLGCFFDEEGTQSVPAPLGLAIPTKANFIAFVALPNSRAFMHRVIGSFRSSTQFPTIGGVGPRSIRGLAWSDHAPFDELGYPALMITDTALFRYVHYHKPTDTADKVNFEKLSRITKGIERVVRDLAR